MLFSQLLKDKLTLPAAMEREISGISLDSRQIVAGNLFFALAGSQQHGEKYIQAALQQGAIAILKETSEWCLETLADNIPCIGLPQLSQQVGEIAAVFYGYPSERLRIVGVTGTNGKTSVTHFIAQMLHRRPQPSGLLGTLGYGIYGTLQSGSHTTPDAIRLQALLAQLRQQQVHTVAMEVSSHALDQGRVNGITFDTAVFTNLSRDHLDYHQTMDAYGEAKRRLFALSHLQTAVINDDDPFGRNLLASLSTTITPLRYSLEHRTAEVYADINRYDCHGCALSIYTAWGKGELQSPLFGQFNVSNLLAALTVLLHWGEDLSELLSRFEQLRTVPGRMERFGQVGQPTVIIDYAHTPDALEKTLLALRAHLASNSASKLWCIFGCGGNRDKGKRPLMGEVAQRLADKVIITDDNPRHESSQAIINDILPGCPIPEAIIPAREQAIRYAIAKANEADIILVAGKGHEDYQQIGEQRIHYSDRELVATLLAGEKFGAIRLGI